MAAGGGGAVEGEEARFMTNEEVAALETNTEVWTLDLPEDDVGATEKRPGLSMKSVQIVGHVHLVHQVRGKTTKTRLVAKIPAASLKLSEKMSRVWDLDAEERIKSPCLRRVDVMDEGDAGSQSSEVSTIELEKVGMMALRHDGERRIREVTLQDWLRWVGRGEADRVRRAAAVERQLDVHKSVKNLVDAVAAMHEGEYVHRRIAPLSVLLKPSAEGRMEAVLGGLWYVLDLSTGGGPEERAARGVQTSMVPQTLRTSLVTPALLGTAASTVTLDAAGRALLRQLDVLCLGDVLGELAYGVSSVGRQAYLAGTSAAVPPSGLAAGEESEPLTLRMVRAAKEKDLFSRGVDSKARKKAHETWVGDVGSDPANQDFVCRVLTSVNAVLLREAWRVAAAELRTVDASASASASASARSAVELDSIRARADPLLLRLVQYVRQPAVAQRPASIAAVRAHPFFSDYVHRVDWMRKVANSIKSEGPGAATPFKTKYFNQLEGWDHPDVAGTKGSLARSEASLEQLREEVLGIDSADELGRCPEEKINWVRALAWRCRGGRGAKADERLLRQCFTWRRDGTIADVSPSEAKLDVALVQSLLPERLHADNPYSRAEKPYPALMWEAWGVHAVRGADGGGGARRYDSSADRVWDVLFGPGEGRCARPLVIVKKYMGTVFSVGHDKVEGLVTMLRNATAHAGEGGGEDGLGTAAMAAEDERRGQLGEASARDVYFVLGGGLFSHMWACVHDNALEPGLPADLL
jgi:hypothetical protein